MPEERKLPDDEVSGRSPSPPEDPWPESNRHKPGALPSPPPGQDDPPTPPVEHQGQ